MASDPQDDLQPYKPQKRFKKLHERSRRRIQDLILHAQVPLQIKDMQGALRSEMRLKVSSSMLHRYLKQELNVSYRKLRPVSSLYNSVDSLLQR